jgi:uncharacterized membrane protein YccF (DUF307 family)
MAPLQMVAGGLFLELGYTLKTHAECVHGIHLPLMACSNLHVEVKCCSFIWQTNAITV